MKSVRITPTPRLQGRITVPGDKSISHRAVMMAALARGPSTLTGLLLGEDVRATIKCFQAMGVPIAVSEHKVVVSGVGLRGLKPPAGVLDCGNSGTTMRLMMGILAGQEFSARLTGDQSLARRPMNRVMDPLKKMGAKIEERRTGPGERIIEVTGATLNGIEYRLPVPSAQVKSAILLAGLYARGESSVIEPVPSRDHTERAFLKKGLPILRQGDRILLRGGREFPGEDQAIPGDISSAAFFLVAGAVAREGRIELEGVGVNPTRTGIMDALAAMGARLRREKERELGGEPVCNLQTEPGPLKATTVSGGLIPRLIDEIPVLGVAAAFAHGVTEVRDAAELRVKESDRIAALEAELKKMSCNINALDDGWRIEGPNVLSGAALESHGDHRIAMALAVAATQARGPSTIADVDCVGTSYPRFWEHLGALGVPVEYV